MLEIGERVERYIVEGQLGEGGLATVFQVRHTTLSTLHALKVVHVQHREARERLIKEGQVQAQLSHENIVAVSDVLDVRGTPALLMELIEGASLEELLYEHACDLEEAISLFRGICMGVGVAHAQGLIHRDLKPANVLLSLSNGRVIPKVADFGLVKAVGANAAPGTTKTGSTLGTPGYMAPEQIRSADRADRRADMWSLGCILYRLLCSHGAFPQSDMIELFTAVGKGDYISPLVHRPELPPYIVELVQGLLETEPDKRIGHCSVVLACIDNETSPVRLSNDTKPTVPVSDKAIWLKEESEVGGIVRRLCNDRDKEQVAQVVGAPAQTYQVPEHKPTILPGIDSEDQKPPLWPLALLIGGFLAMAVGAIMMSGLFSAWLFTPVVAVNEPEEPVVAQPVVEQPVEPEQPAEPKPAEPVLDVNPENPTPEPAEPEPISEPKSEEPAQTEPVQAEPVAPKPVVEEPAKPEPVVKKSKPALSCTGCKDMPGVMLTSRFGARIAKGPVKPGSYSIKYNGNTVGSISLAVETEQVRISCEPGSTPRCKQR